MARQRTIKINIVGDASSAQGAVVGLTGSLGSFGKGIGKLLGAAGLVGLVMKLKEAATASVRMATQFESSMTKIISLVGISREQVDEWSDQIKRLGPEVGRSPQELADAMFFITSAGLRGSEAMDALEASSKAAAVGLGETKDIAFAAVSAMNAYGAENLTAERAVDILTATVREGNVEASEVAQVLGRIIPIAAELGVGFDQVGGAVAAMTRTGANAAEAMTGLSGIFRAIIKPSGDAEKILSQYGLSALGLRKQLKEEGLLSVLGTLSEVFGDNEEAMTQVFGRVQGLTAFLSLMGQNAETNVGIFENVADSVGLADEAFAIASETAEFKLNQAMSKLQVIGTEVGAEMLPKIIDALDQVLPALENMLPALGEFITALMTFGNSILPVIVPLMKTTGDVFKGFGIILNDIVGIWDENAAAANRFVAAQENVKNAVEDGEDVATAMANSLFHLIANGELTSQKFRSLAADANLSDEALDAVRETLIQKNAELLANQQRMEALTTVHQRWINNGIVPTEEELANLGVEVKDGQVAINVLEQALLSADAVLAENTVSTAELAETIGAEYTPEVEDADRVLKGYAERTRDATDATDDALDPTIELADETKDLRDQLIDAAAAQESLSDVLAAAADPVFNAVNSFNSYQKELEKYDEMAKDSSVTSEELAAQQLKIAEAALKAQGGLDALSPEALEDALAAVATALGITTDEAEDLLRELGILDGKSVTTVVNVRAPTVSYELLEGGTVRPKLGRMNVFQRGGIVTDPLLGLIGETGEDEAIIPLNQQGIDFLAEALRKAGIGGEGVAGGTGTQVSFGDINVRSEADADDLAQAIAWRLRTLGI